MSEKAKKAQKITESDLKNTYFVPIKRMNEVIEHIDHLSVNRRKNTLKIRCDYNLLDLKRERSTREWYHEVEQRYAAARHKSLFVSSCYKALYAHDWDRLLYILKRVPRWRFDNMHTFHTRILSILLMYHPDSQSKGYFNEYLHMVWGCRSEQNKKAIQKTLLTLCKRMFRTQQLEQFWRDTQEQRKKAFAAMAEKNEDVD